MTNVPDVAPSPPEAMEPPRRWWLDPSLWVLIAGVVLRIDVVLRFTPEHGYDSFAHFRYTELLAGGEVPRVGVNTWAAQHPPLFYVLALALERLGLGHEGGQWISLLAGVVRLVLADRLFVHLSARAVRDGAPLEACRHARLFANIIHAFIPVGIRMDAFYSPESLAATTSLAAVYAAFRSRSVVLAGLLLGLALLSKATAVVAIPAAALALAFGGAGHTRRGSGGAGPAVGLALRLPDPAGLRRAAIGLAIAFAITGSWAAGNIARFGTPYPNAYRVQGDEVWKLPLFQRHHSSYYLPDASVEALAFPFYVSPPLSMPNVLVFDAWGDYYNFLNRGLRHGRKPPEATNGRELGVPRLTLHRVYAGLGVVLTLVLFGGMIGAIRRALRGQLGAEELAHAILGAGYVFVMVWYAIWVPHEHDGPAKAAYGLGASAILSYWTGRGLAAFGWIGPAGRLGPALLAGTVVALAVALRIVW